MKHFNLSIYLKMYNKVHQCSLINDATQIRHELDAVKHYLNECKMYMPEQIYPYNRDDMSTWRYLPRPAGSDYASCDRKGWTMLNREWKYA